MKPFCFATHVNRDNTLRLDVYGKYEAGGYTTSFLTADEAMEMSRKLAADALKMGWRRAPDTEDLV